jgi:hypothetical protein
MPNFGEIAQRFGVSTDVVQTLQQALERGGGTMAQFNHPELGGMGQWQGGGMTMVGDMFNNALKAKVDALCTELSGSYKAPSSAPFTMNFASNLAWWDSSLGTPTSVGAQNNMDYAYFPATKRLAVRFQGKTTVYDTLDHVITGFSQAQQSPLGAQMLVFQSQHGQCTLGALKTL